MNFRIFLFLLFAFASVKAQPLKLKPKQKFSYETIASRDEKNERYSSDSYRYCRSNFEVLSALNGTYKLKVTPVLILTKKL